MNALRDRIVHAVCNTLIRHVATTEYRAFISACMDLGQGRLDRKLLDPSDAWHYPL